MGACSRDWRGGSNERRGAGVGALRAPSDVVAAAAGLRSGKWNELSLRFRAGVAVELDAIE